MIAYDGPCRLHLCCVIFLDLGRENLVEKWDDSKYLVFRKE